jgi:hypothetical protein
VPVGRLVDDLLAVGFRTWHAEFVFVCHAAIVPEKQCLSIRVFMDVQPSKASAQSLYGGRIDLLGV